jgi:hypothetical protein
MGRPITNNSARAQRNREQMRRAREAMKERPINFNPKPLAEAVNKWRAQ